MNIPRIKALRPDWISEVTGIDLQHAAGDAGTLRSTLFARLVLVIRNQRLQSRELVELARAFGTPEPPWDEHNCDPAEPMVQIFRSDGPKPYRRPTEFWHTDGSFLGQPTMVTLLHLVEKPAEGGDTLFANMQAAWAALPEHDRDRLVSGVGIHSYGYQFDALRQEGGKQTLAATERARFPDVTHPLVCHHPITGMPALYLNELCLARTVGAEHDRSLVDALLRHATEPRFVYRHVWEPGDVLVWDNRSVMHRATPIGHGCVREVRRVTSRY